MGIEDPLALVALLAVAAPVLLHLRSRRAARLVRFPNVELVREVGRELGRERIVADAWLLAARSGAVALAALTVARPYVGARPPSEAEGAACGTVVVLDRSGAWPSGGAFDEARAAAREVLDLAARGGRAVLLPFDSAPGPALEGDAARRALERVRPTGRSRSVAAALEAAGRMPFAPGPGGGPPVRTVVLIAGPGAEREVPGTAPGAATKLLVLAPPAPRGAGVVIADAAVRTPYPRVGDPVRVRVRLERDASAPAPAGAEVRMYFGGDADPAATRDVPGAAFDDSGSAEVTVEAVRRRPAAALVRVELEGGEARFLALPPAERLRVLCVGTEGRGSAEDVAVARRAVEALAAAAGLSSAVLPIETVSARDVDPLALEAYDVVLTGDVEAVPARSWADLEAFVRAGGSLLAAAPGGLPPEARRLFGVRRTGDGPERVAPAGGAAIAVPARDPSAGTLRRLEDVRFPSYLRARTGGAAALAFDTGDPALAVRRVGRGRAGLFAAGLAGLRGRPAALVPLVDALLRRAARRADPPLVAEAEDTPLVITVDADDAAAGITLVAPDGARVDVAVPRPGGPGGRAFAVLPCEGPGLWRLVTRGRGGGVAAGDELTLRLVGVNARAGRPGGRPAPRVDDATASFRSLGGILAEIDPRASIGLGPAFAVLLLAALAAELALMEARAHGRPKKPAAGGPE